MLTSFQNRSKITDSSTPDVNFTRKLGVKPTLHWYLWRAADGTSTLTVIMKKISFRKVWPLWVQRPKTLELSSLRDCFQYILHWLTVSRKNSRTFGGLHSEMKQFATQHSTKVPRQVQCRAGSSKMAGVGLILTALTSWTRCRAQIWKTITGTCRNHPK